jgi:dolichyl-phosphate-mannose--protein O-mannosyl transferase
MNAAGDGPAGDVRDAAPSRPWRMGLVAVLALAATLLLVRLSQPDWTPPRPRPDLPKRYVWDECLYGFTVHRHLSGDPDVWRPDRRFADLREFDTTDLGPHVGYAIYHPPLAVFCMTAASSVLGWSSFSVRLPGAFCGVALVAATWFFTRRLRGEAVATLAAALVALDGVWFTISRIAIPHMYVAAATAWALVAGFTAWQDDRRRARLTIATGAVCGVALAFKLSALFPAVLLGLALLLRAATRGAEGSRRRGLAAWAVGFLVLPPAIYLASWLPFFLVWDKTWEDFLAVHRHMRAWHASMPPQMGPSTPWWTWPAIWKPITLFEASGPAGVIRQIVCRGNPLLWWAAIPAIAWAAVRFARRRHAGDAFLIIGYLAAWIVHAFVPRFGFAYYMLPAAPCAAAAVATALDDACVARALPRRVVFGTWATLAAGVFAGVYPWLSAVPMTR